VGAGVDDLFGIGGHGLESGDWRIEISEGIVPVSGTKGGRLS
jgi:hypothetical protein